jgi:hypothetical protein
MQASTCLTVRVHISHRVFSPIYFLPFPLLHRYIPSELGYGERGSPPKIGGGDVLVFKMEIITIKGGKKLANRCAPATGEGCSDKEKKFIKKAAAKYAGAKLGAELKRLQGMTAKSMKPELQAWLQQRISILTAMDTKAEL